MEEPVYNKKEWRLQGQTDKEMEMKIHENIPIPGSSYRWDPSYKPTFPLVEPFISFLYYL